MLICHTVYLTKWGLNGSSEDLNAMHVELYDPDMPIDNEQLSLLTSMLDSLEYSVDECEHVYLAVRQFINECSYDNMIE